MRTSMRICDLQSSSTRLQRAARDLNEHWTNTKEYWHDQTSSDFEESHVKPLLPEIAMALSAVNRLHELLEQAERDLQEHEPDV